MRKYGMTGAILLLSITAAAYGMGGKPPAPPVDSKQVPPSHAKIVNPRSFAKEEIERMKLVRGVLATPYGRVTIAFLPEAAPNNVYNFITLARAHFYDGTTLHRALPGTLVQGGDPYTVKGKRHLYNTGNAGFFTRSEIGRLKHARGTVSMAKLDFPDSNSSQFFVCLRDVPEFDGRYTVIGKVEKGIDILDRISRMPRDERNLLTDRVVVSMTIEE